MASKVQLTPTQIDAVNAARRVLNDIVPDMDAAEKCGVDCQQLRTKATTIADGLSNIVKHFAPQLGAK